MESPLNIQIFVFLLTTWKATLGQEISCNGSGICQVTVCLYLQPTCLLLSPPDVIDPPLSPTQVWYHYIQDLHCDPTTSQWIAMYYIFFFNFFTFCED